MQQHGSNYFAPRTDPKPGTVANRSTFIFQNMVMLHINLIDLGWGGVSKCQNATVSEHGHVTYQIKWIHECSNIEANNLLNLVCVCVRGVKL